MTISTTEAEALLAAITAAEGHVTEDQVDKLIKSLAFGIAAAKALEAAEGLEHWTPEHHSEWWYATVLPALTLWSALRWGGRSPSGEGEEGHD